MAQTAPVWLQLGRFKDLLEQHYDEDTQTKDPFKGSVSWVGNMMRIPTYPQPIQEPKRERESSD